VISDITGVTGLRILRDIVAGRTDPHALAQHRDHRCQASAAEITAALTGHYRPEHVFVLQQNLELFDAYQRQLAACDAAIEAHVQTLAAQAPVPAGPLPAPRTKKKPRDNEPQFDIRTPLHQLTGVDLTQLDAIGPYSALRLLAEIGTDMSRFPTAGHLISWAGLCPKNDESAGKRRSARMRKGAPWLKTTLIQCAWAATRRTDSYLQAQFHRLRARRGAKKAVCAVAASILTAAYHMIQRNLLPGPRCRPLQASRQARIGKPPRRQAPKSRLRRAPQTHRRMTRCSSAEFLSRISAQYSKPAPTSAA
jgi:transposase